MSQETNRAGEDAALPDYAPLLERVSSRLCGGAGRHCRHVASAAGRSGARSGMWRWGLHPAIGRRGWQLGHGLGDRSFARGSKPRRAMIRRLRQRLPYCQATAVQLPLADDSFDLVWCAQSFYSLDNPAAVVREMVRVGAAGRGDRDSGKRHLAPFAVPWPVESSWKCGSPSSHLCERDFAAAEVLRRPPAVGRIVGSRLGAYRRKGLGHDAAIPAGRGRPTFLPNISTTCDSRIAAVLEPETLGRLDAWLGTT